MLLIAVVYCMVAVEARHAVPLRGLAFADSYTQDGKPCPPECVSDSMEIVTWYPSPYNEYEELRLYPISESNSPNAECGQDNRGLMYYDKDDDKVYICKGAILGWKELGSGGSLTQSDTSSSFCDSTNLGTIVYDTAQKRPYVCAQNTSNGYVWKPLDSDYDRDGITDAVDYNDNDANDATAIEVDVASGKTFYARGGSRRTGTLVSSDIGGICVALSSSMGGGYHMHNGEMYSSFAYPSVILENAFSNTTAKFDCGYWHSSAGVCGCPNGYTLTKFGYLSLSTSNYTGWQDFYYCKKN